MLSLTTSQSKQLNSTKNIVYYRFKTYRESKIKMNYFEKRMFTKVDPRNLYLVDKLVRDNVIQSPKVSQVMSSIDRGHFIKDNRESVYHDSPQTIGYCATISAPHMHAYALE